MEEIINRLESIISNIFNITIEELRDNKKLRSHTDARSILFYFLHVKYGISFYRLSKIYNKHHSTIIRAVMEIIMMVGEVNGLFGLFLS